MESSTKDSLTDRSKWVRILYMVFFALAYAVAELLFWLVTLFQAVVVLITGRANEGALRFGHNLSVYVYQIVQFETFNDEYLPFPFNDWPDESPSPDNVWLDRAGQTAAAAASTADPADAPEATPETGDDAGDAGQSGLESDDAEGGEADKPQA